MTHDNTLTRRQAMGAMATAGAITAAATTTTSNADAQETTGIKHSACYWCYRGKLSLEELAAYAASIGMHSIELLDPEDWPVVQKHGLTCAMANGPGGIPRGWNDPRLHDELTKRSEELLPKVAEAGMPNMIVFSGNRDGLSDDEGLKNCATGLKRIMPLAEELGVTVCMELLNSKRDHKDYQCDHTPWGVELAQRVESDRFKLLYDIYHMQIMEGDVIATIQENIEYIGHFHTGGVPGRHEIDETQELNYAAIVQGIVATGFEGYIGQEFIPVEDPKASLKEGVEICTA